MHPLEGLPGSQSISSEALKLPAETLSPTDSERQICRPDCGDTCTLVDLTEETRSGIHYSKTALEMIRSIGSFSLDDPTRHTLRSATTVKGGSNEASSSCAKAFMLWSDWFKSADMLKDQNAGAQSAHEYDRDYAVNGPDKVFYRNSNRLGRRDVSGWNSTTGAYGLTAYHNSVACPCAIPSRSRRDLACGSLHHGMEAIRGQLAGKEPRFSLSVPR